MTACPGKIRVAWCGASSQAGLSPRVWRSLRAVLLVYPLTSFTLGWCRAVLRPLRCLVWFVGPILVACDTPAAVQTVITDSAGVVIAVTDERDSRLAWQVHEALTLGGKEQGPQSFFVVSRATVAIGADGRIHVWDGMTHAVHAFDSAGRHLWSVGREGQGPGEITYGNSIAADEKNRVFVYDGGKGGLVVFGSEGELLPQVPFPASPIRARQPHFDVHARGFVFWRRERYQGSDQRRTELLWTDDADTAVLVFTDQPITRTARFPGCPLALGLPVLGAPLLNWHRAGQRVAVNHVPEYIIEVFDEGRRTLSIRRTIAPEPITEAEALRHYSSQTEPGPLAGMCRASAREMVKQLGFAPKHQILTGLAVAPDGSIWARRRDGTGGNLIDVFDPGGRYLGTLPPSTPFPIAFIDRDRFVFAVSDSLDVQRLVIARLARDRDVQL